MWKSQIEINATNHFTKHKIILYISHIFIIIIAISFIK